MAETVGMAVIMIVVVGMCVFVGVCHRYGFIGNRRGRVQRSQ